MSDCGKKFGPRRLTCVKAVGHKGRHTHVRSARNIGQRLRNKGRS
jgi:hypothetical protein